MVRIIVLGTLLVSVTGLSLGAPQSALAQPGDVVYPGSTVQGDTLRGQGQFLKGMAWYELNAAKAFEINSKAAIALERWNRQVYEAYMRERAAHIQYRANQTKAQAEAARKKYEEREERLRTKPTPDDIVTGDALNALLIDLSAPSIGASSWRLAKVDLPEDLPMRSLVFRLAPKPGDKATQEMSKGVIALGRLNMEGTWPKSLQDDRLAPEREAYEKAFRNIRERSLAGKLNYPDVQPLREIIDKLRVRASEVVTTDLGFKASALSYVDEMKKSTVMFHADTIAYVEELIADTQNHDAHTVGELLAFMWKYRLRFANAAKDPKAGVLYEQLYGLMREQKEKLGVKEGGPNPAVVQLGFRKGTSVTGSLMTGNISPDGEPVPNISNFKFSLLITSSEGGAIGGELTWGVEGAPVQSIKGTASENGKFEFQSLENLRGKFFLNSHWQGSIDESGNVTGTYKREKRIGKFSGKIKT